MFVYKRAMVISRGLCACTVLYTKTREQIFIRLYLVTREYASVERGEKGTFSEDRFARFFNRTRGGGAKRTPRKTFSKDNRGGFEEKKRKKRKKRRVAEETCKSCPPPPRCQLNVVYRVYCLADEKYSSRIRQR